MPPFPLSYVLVYLVISVSIAQSFMNNQFIILNSELLSDKRLLKIHLVFLFTFPCS